MREAASVVILTVASLLVGCAAQVPSTLPGAGASHAGLAAAASAATRSNDDVTARGYDVVVVKGRKLFCRTQSTTDSHIKRTVCLTLAQLKAEQENTRQLLEGMQRADAAGQQVTMSCGGATGAPNPTCGH